MNSHTIMQNLVSQTNTSVDTLLDSLRSCTDFQNFMCWIAWYTHAHKDAVRNTYAKWIATIESRTVKKTLQNALSIFRNSSELFPAFCEFFIEIMQQNKDVADNICLLVLELFDQQLSIIFDDDDIEASLSHYVPNISSPSGYLVFPVPPVSFQSAKLSSAKIREYRNLHSWDPVSPHNLRNYIFIPEAFFEGEFPTISYCGTQVLVNNNIDSHLRIAIVPIGKDAWFQTKFDHQNKQFTCAYPCEEINSVVNNVICNSISVAAQNKAHVIVFPELAINPLTISGVTQHLKDNPWIKANTLLIVLGTYWFDGNNEGYVINGSGTTLLHSYKHIPYEHFELVDGQHMKFTEYLRDTQKPLQYLDVPGIGRLAWHICRDFLADHITSISTRLHSTMVLVSAYTKRTAEMQASAEALAKAYGIITVLSNRCINCEGSSTNTERGFVYVPEIIEEERLIGNQSHSLCCPKLCTATACISSNCRWMCSISRELICSFTEL